MDALVDSQFHFDNDSDDDNMMLDDEDVQECADMYFSADDCHVLEELEKALRYQAENYRAFVAKINAEVRARQSLQGEAPAVTVEAQPDNVFKLKNCQFSKLAIFRTFYQVDPTK